MKVGANRYTAGALALALALMCMLGASAAARVFNGTSKANRVIGTNKSDVIRLAAGNDRAKGRGGADRITGAQGRDRLNGGRGGDRVNGGTGKDRLAGGKSADHLKGGPGDDQLNAVDAGKDANVDGGAGRNVCRIDAADLSVVRRCFEINVVPGGPGPGQGSDGGGETTLALRSASGLSCGSSLPTCSFELSGTGADATVGTVSGGGGVQPGGGAAVSTSNAEWTANGLYGCTHDGFLRVSIGSEHLDVAVTCAA